MATEYFNDAWRIPNNKNQSLVSNYSMEFDASSGDTIQLNNAGNSLFNNATAFTISAWINPLDTGTMQNILTNYGNAVARQNVMLRWNSTEALQFYVVTTSGVKILNTVNNLIQYNQWQHIVATYDGINSKIYYNGTLSNSIAATGVVATSTEQDQIGWRAPYGQYFNGKMDQVCVFDYALSATQVSTLYGGGTAVTNPMSLSPKPIAYYQLGDQTASNNTTEPDPPVQSYLVPNNSLQDYVFNFDGSDDYIDLGNDSSLQFANSFSISAWAKINDTSNNAIISKDSSGATGNGYHIDFRSGNQVHAWAYNASNKVIKTGLNTDIWYHIVFVFQNTGGSNGTQSLYINGGTAVTNSITNFASSTINNLRIGSSEEISGFQTNGLISNVALFNTNLTPTQVQTLYNNGSPATDISSLSPVSWWKLNAADTFDGNDWTINDYAGSNDGTSVDMTSANLVQSNLQHTSGFSPYALSFDGTNDVINCGNDSSLQITGAMTVSYWFKGQGGSNIAGGVGKLGGSSSRGFLFGMTSTGVINFYIAPTASSLVLASYSHTPDTNWHHLVGVFTPSTSLELYFDGQLVDTTPTSTSSQYNASNNLQIGARGDSTGFFNGKMSNAAIWNTNLTSTEITEVYNQGVPSNLNTFSGTAPVSWWQLGSNSSFNTNWDCLDEIGNNDGVSAGNMTEDNITNGVGYSANGLGTSSIEIIGDAPYSTANGISENMDVLDRTTDVPS